LLDSLLQEIKRQYKDYTTSKEILLTQNFLT